MGGTTFLVGLVVDGKPVHDHVHGPQPVHDQHPDGRRPHDRRRRRRDRLGRPGGNLRVGPRSAGARPGPACYGDGGTEPTVTDADLVLGIVNPDNFLGGRKKLDRAARAEEAIRQGRLADPLGLDVDDAARGDLRDPERADRRPGPQGRRQLRARPARLRRLRLRRRRADALRQLFARTWASRRWSSRSGSTAAVVLRLRPGGLATSSSPPSGPSPRRCRSTRTTVQRRVRRAGGGAARSGSAAQRPAISPGSATSARSTCATPCSWPRCPPRCASGDARRRRGRRADRGRLRAPLRGALRQGRRVPASRAAADHLPRPCGRHAADPLRSCPTMPPRDGEPGRAGVARCSSTSAPAGRRPPSTTTAPCVPGTGSPAPPSSRPPPRPSRCRPSTRRRRRPARQSRHPPHPFRGGLLMAAVPVAGSEQFAQGGHPLAPGDTFGDVTLHTRRPTSVGRRPAHLRGDPAPPGRDHRGHGRRRSSGCPARSSSPTATTSAPAIMDESGETVQVGLYNTQLGSALDMAVRWTLQHRCVEPGHPPGDSSCSTTRGSAAGCTRTTSPCSRRCSTTDELFGWTGAVAHQVDLGGVSPGSWSVDGRDVFWESLPIPPVKIVEGGRLRADIEDSYLRRSRVPKLVGPGPAGQDRREQRRPGAADALDRQVRRRHGQGRDEEDDVRRRDPPARTGCGELPDGSWSAVAHQDGARAGDRDDLQDRA